MSRVSVIASIAAGVLATVVLGAAGPTASPAGAKAYFIDLADGASVKSPVTVRFGLSGMGVAPAGVEKEGTGHHHLLIDTTLSADELSENIVADEKHLHFGKGQTETSVKLAPGKHTLQIVVGDHNHIPLNPPVMSPVITVTVTE